ncbi:unnamed protein product [Wickerhamomyces anomalus]
MMFPFKSIVSQKQQSSILGSLISTRSVSLLSSLKPSYNSTSSIKRVGRGPSSGYGKTSGRGQKGQKARGKVKSWFEGGQTPIFKLFPKIGFNNVKALQLKEVNLIRIIQFHQDGRLDLKEGETLNMRKMKQIGLVTGTLRDGVKISSYRAGGEFTARFFTKLGLRAHLHPMHFLKTRGYIPLPGRPASKRNIDYYSNPRKRGYLIKENDPLLQAIRDAKDAPIKARELKKTALEGLLNGASGTNKSGAGFVKSGVVKFSDLNL